MAKYLALILLFACEITPKQQTQIISNLNYMAQNSSCATYVWKNRGVAPSGYVKGMAQAYAKSLCNISNIATQPLTASDKMDALYWYRNEFKAIGEYDAKPQGMLIRNFTLLMGLGMRESTGRHCVGRDQTASNVTPSTVEAGLFQSSYNSSNFNAELKTLRDKYQSSSKCMGDVFKENVTCGAKDWENYGSGDGFEFQKLSKECPAYAVEYNAILIRLAGGSMGHFGPLRRKEVEVRKECRDMFKAIETVIVAQPKICEVFK